MRYDVVNLTISIYNIMYCTARLLLIYCDENRLTIFTSEGISILVVKGEKQKVVIFLQIWYRYRMRVKNVTLLACITSL